MLFVILLLFYTVQRLEKVHNIIMLVASTYNIRIKVRMYGFLATGLWQHNSFCLFMM